MIQSGKITPCLWFDSQAAGSATRNRPAMLKMKKIDLAELERAYKGEGALSDTSRSPRR